jgi:hypothetical protein
MFNKIVDIPEKLHGRNATALEVIEHDNAVTGILEEV